MEAMDRSHIRLAAIILSFNIVISALLPAFSHSKDIAGLSDDLKLYGNHTSYHEFSVFGAYHNKMSTEDIIRLTVSINENLAIRDETEMIERISTPFDEVGAPHHIFTINPSLIPINKFLESREGYFLSKTVFYTDINLQQIEGDTARLDSRYDIQQHFISFKQNTYSKNTHVSLQHVRRSDDWLHENLSDRISAYSESPEIPNSPEPSYIPDSYSPYDEIGTYSYHDSKQWNGGNVKLPLYIPWFRKKPDRIGLLPDTIYIGADIDYFNIAESLHSLKSGNGASSSDVYRFDSDWFDTHSGYIHFEWRLGK